MCHKDANYPGELSDEQWALVEAMDINAHWGPGRRMGLELRAVINAILYLLRASCQCRYLPKCFSDEEAVRKAFYLAHRDTASKWTMPPAGPRSSTNSSFIFDGRIAI